MRWRDVKQNKIQPKSEPKISMPIQHYASHLDKIKAFITDSFLLAMPIFYIVIYLVMGNREGFAAHMVAGWLYILMPLGLIVTLFYTFSGQTPGMKAYHIKVIDNKTGKKPSFALSILRFFFFNIVLFTVIGLFFGFYRQDKRALHDILSGTSIVSAS